jgi:hypothetical protein
MQETGPLESLKVDQNFLRVAHQLPNPSSGAAALRLKQTVAHWEDIVGQFARRELTYDIDRLPALSSLAEQLSTRSFDIYFAGLWSYCLVEKDGLCWRRKYSTGPGGRSSEYCAPTWSWASAKGEIELDGIATLWPVQTLDKGGSLTKLASNALTALQRALMSL